MTTKASPRIGLGCMGMSEFYGPSDDKQSLQVLMAAHDLGYRHFDTADMYGLGQNEKLLGKFIAALGSRRQEIEVATKGGIRRSPDAPGSIAVDSSPAYLKKACEESLKRLGIDCIDLYYLHRRNKDVPIEESMGAMQDLLREGKIRLVGLSEVSTDTLRRAATVVPIAVLQSEYSLWTRDPEAELIDLCGVLNTRMVAYSPIGRGFLSGRMDPAQLSSTDLRSKLPRFQSEAFAINAELVQAVEAVARDLDATAAQVALAWVLAARPWVMAIPGTRNPKRLMENFSSQQLVLSPAQKQHLDDVFAPTAIAGTRYPSALLGTVNN